MRLETGANDPHLHPSCECAATSSLKYLPKKMCLLLKITFSWRVRESFSLYHIYSSWDVSFESYPYFWLRIPSQSET